MKNSGFVLNDKITKSIQKWGFKTTQEERAGALRDWTPEIANQFRDVFNNDIERLLYDKYFLGLNRVAHDDVIPKQNCLYPIHHDDILAIYEERKKRNINLVILIEGIGSGKSTVNSVLTWLEWFRMSTLYDPQGYYGMMNDEIIASIAMSRSEAQAKRVTLQKIYPKFNTQFNLEYFPPSKRKGQEIWIPRNNTLVFAGTSNAASALGYNIPGGVIDEANFLEVITGSERVQSNAETYDAAQEMHDAMFNRMNSRFINPYTGLLDGMLIMISSSRYPNDFLERKAREHFKLGEKSHIFVRRRTLWECKPKWYFSGVKFQFDIREKKIVQTAEEIDSLIVDAKEIKAEQSRVNALRAQGLTL